MECSRLFLFFRNKKASKILHSCDTLPTIIRYTESMQISEHRYNVWFRAIVIGVVCLLLVSNNAWAESLSCDSSKSTLAASLRTPEEKFREDFTRMDFLLAHYAPNDYVREQIEQNPSAYEWTSATKHGDMAVSYTHLTLPTKRIV